MQHHSAAFLIACKSQAEHLLAYIEGTGTHVPVLLYWMYGVKPS
jgi:hypothetical protein